MALSGHPGLLGSRSCVALISPEMSKFEQLRAACEYFDHSEESLIQVMHRAQELFGYLREDVIKFVADELTLPVSRVYGVATFYSFFSTVPQGRHVILVCMGTACYVRGAERVLNELKKELGIDLDQTTPDGMFSLRTARCIGACGMAPAVVVDEDVYSQVKPEHVKDMLKKYR